MAVMRADGVLDAVVDGKTVLIDPAGTHIVDLNAVGSLVWSGLDGQRGVRDLVDLVRQALDDQEQVAEAQIESDVTAFLAELSRLDLLEPTARPAGQQLPTP